MTKMDTVLKWIGIAKIILPFVFASKGVDPALIGHITDLVTDAEAALGPGTGADKAAAVLKGVDDAMTAAGVDPAKIGATKDLVTIGLSDGIKAVNDIHTLKASTPPPVH